jgi:hypothetical protein
MKCCYKHTENHMAQTVFSPFVKPSPIHVYVTIKPTKTNGLKEPYTGRVGLCNDMVEAKRLIASDKAAMGNTFGGLVDAVTTTDRTYRAFKAEWTEIKLD